MLHNEDLVMIWRTQHQSIPKSPFQDFEIPAQLWLYLSYFNWPNVLRVFQRQQARLI